MNVTVWNSTKKMILALFLLCMIVPFLSSCTDDDDYTVGVWYKRAALDGPVRGYAAAFTIGNKGYIATGYNASATEPFLNDLWVYDIDGNYWTQLKEMPTAASYRNKAVGFTVGEKGYITTGIGDNNVCMKDTWEYDPDTDAWTQKDDFAGGIRYGALAFSIGNYAYVGTGFDTSNYKKDFYKFDPSAASGSQWTVLTGLSVDKRMFGTAFVIDNVAYILGGVANSSYPTDFWSYDPSTGVSTALRDIADVNSDEDYDDDYDNMARSGAVSFVIDGKGYFVTGERSSSLKTDYWVYDPATDLWSGDSDDDYTPFALLNSGNQGSMRSNAVSFSTGTRGFVLTGAASSSSYLDDMYELSPYENRDE
ncbi:MAG: galactose oxidase [Bacteroidetes bacterium]|nr:galactose oxidase [Bacteroidota bacterium]